MRCVTQASTVDMRCVSALRNEQYIGDDPWMEYLTLANEFVSRDPRVVLPAFDAASGKWQIAATLTLEPSSSFLDGFWYDEYGLIHVRTDKRQFQAQEYPHPRRCAISILQCRILGG